MRRSLSQGVRVGLVSLFAPAAAGAAEPTSGSPAAVTYSLTLDQAVQMTLTRNVRAKISDLNVVVADAAVEKAFAAFLPSVVGTASGVQHATVVRPPGNAGTAGLTVTQPLLNAPAFPLYAQARRLADAQRSQNVDDRRLLGFTAASAFFAVLNAQDIVTAAERQLDNARSNFASTQARAKAQLSSTNDTTKAQLDMAGSEREVENDKGVLDGALVQLAFTLYAPLPSTLVPPQPTLDAAERPIAAVDPLVRFATDHRPDVEVSRYQSMAAHDFAGEPLLRIVPAIGLQGQVVDTTAESALTGRHDDETVTPT